MICVFSYPLKLLVPCPLISLTGCNNINHLDRVFLFNLDINLVQIPTLRWKSAWLLYLAVDIGLSIECSCLSHMIFRDIIYKTETCCFLFIINFQVSAFCVNQNNKCTSDNPDVVNIYNIGVYMSTTYRNVNIFMFINYKPQY